MPADLTRFDFHALRFMKSLDVMAMSAEEVGQYVLLLCESWLIGDDCTLPDDSTLLERMARSKVSPKVLEKFPVIKTEKWGKRRRNPILYYEWEKAGERSQNGRNAVEARWQYERNTSVLPNPIQSNSNQNQSNIDFNNLSRQFKRKFGFKPGKRPQDKQEYSAACGKYGEEWVLDKFKEWADDNEWVKERHAKFPLADFFSGLDDEKEEEELANAENAVAQELAEAIAKQDEEARQAIEAKLAEIEKQKEIEKSIPADAF